MKKKILAFGFALTLCFALVLPVWAAEDAPPRLADEARLLTSSETEDLSTLLNEISDRQKCDVIILTVDSVEGADPEWYAGARYLRDGYGQGEDADGILLLISKERDWAITAFGDGHTAVSDIAAREYIADRILPDLGKDRYKKAFTLYAELCDKFITQAKTGEPYKNGSLPAVPLSPVWIPLSLVIGFALAFIITWVMKGKLKSVRKQAAAGDYLKAGSLNVTESRDMFLYTRMSKTPKPQNNSSGGGGSGGGHHSSSSSRSISGKF